ncbi:MAG TPA: DCC1-like thiol-disulfide oxidoreductase family protein [Tepidisphaeraceae bacterium]|nr:DCC1-like thiol-disulfide oxidoreductase family protein [Tepidisphaeraceae bacterium]
MSANVPDAHTANGPIVLFDGVCGLCDASVKFIVDHDPSGIFRFATLQSPAARALLMQHRLNPDVLSSIVLIDAGRAYTRSTAALRIGHRLSPQALSLLSLAAIVIPSPIRDAVYDFIARHRYRWFGQLDACRRPTEAEALRFIA